MNKMKEGSNTVSVQHPSFLAKTLVVILFKQKYFVREFCSFFIYFFRL